MGAPGWLFYVVFLIALVGWVALFIFPARPKANFLIAGLIVPVTLGVFYTVSMLLWWNVEPVGRFSNFLSLRGLQNMFQNPGLLLAAWIDLLVIPLIVGAWMARRATQIRMPRVWLYLCLAVTLGFPGTGFVLFALIVLWKGRWKDIASLEDVAPLDCAPVSITAKATTTE